MAVRRMMRWLVGNAISPAEPDREIARRLFSDAWRGRQER